MDILRALWKSGQGVRASEGAAAPPADDAVVPPGEAAEEGPPEIIKEPPMEIDGRVMSPEEFVHYVEGLHIADPQPTRVFLHHTWRPTRETWRGHETILGMKAYYERQIWEDRYGNLHEGWNAGPHLFVADDGIWLFSDLAHDGVGVYGHNYRTRHLEMVGNYDDELPQGATLENTVAALGILHERLGLDIQQLNFHRDYSTKTCPGRAVTRAWIIPQVAQWIAAYRRQRAERQSELRRSLVRMIADLLVSMNEGAALAKSATARGLLGALTHEIPMEIDDQAYIVQLFAEALIVPVNQWAKVESLDAYEQRTRRRGARAPERDRLTDEPDAQRAPPPTDPYGFQGEIR